MKRKLISKNYLNTVNILDGEKSQSIQGFETYEVRLILLFFFLSLEQITILCLGNVPYRCFWKDI